MLQINWQLYKINDTFEKTYLKFSKDWLTFFSNYKALLNFLKVISKFSEFLNIRTL